MTWTVADGRKGRRWRAVTTSGDRLLNALLVEVAPDGALAKIEVAAPAGLLTLHPEPDMSELHGNVVRADGIEHVAMPWSPAHVLMLGASPVTAAVAAARLAERIGAARGFTAQLEEGESVVGGGSTPGQSLPTRLVVVAHGRMSAQELEARLRRSSPPVIARIDHGRLLLDLRTVFPEQEDLVLDAFDQMTRIVNSE